MGLEFTLLYAAHARGIHHKLAFDALAAIETADAERWRRLFFKHAELFATGAKAPDDVFKDFKNHVLHPRDGFWGGAPATARLWYGKTVAAMRAGDWPGAVYNAGVLSHYVTDPVQPFHTGQSDAESAIHRAFEWSTSKSYADLVRAGSPAPAMTVPASEDWLEDMLRRAAVHSNAHYDACVASYDLDAGVVDPPAGLNGSLRKILGDLIRHASALYARVLSRAIAEAGVSPPDVSLSLDAVLATLKLPIKAVAARIADGRERALVLAMYDELKATGRVEATLPEDDRAVRDLHAVEVLGSLSSTASQPAAEDAGKASRAVPRRTRAITRLEPGDDVVDAPCIGPATAKRLGAIGIRTVADFMAGDSSSIAARLGAAHIRSADVATWQAATRLVLAVPGLSGTGAQLLAGAGYLDPATIASAKLEKLEADVLAFARGVAGKRVLREAAPPEPSDIARWAQRTREALAA